MAFARRYPDIELDVSFADRLVSVVDEGFDLALRIGSLTDSSRTPFVCNTQRGGGIAGLRPATANRRTGSNSTSTA